MTPDKAAYGASLRQARSQRVRMIRRRVIAGALALFAATWLFITLVLVTGHDPALASQKAVAATTTSTSSTPSTTSSASSNPSTSSTSSTPSPSSAGTSSASSGSSSGTSALTSSQS